MNRPLRRIALAMMVLFALMLANLNYVQAIQARELNGKPATSASSWRSTTVSAVTSWSPVARSPAPWRPRTS
jgi:hypothetical protein